MAIDVSWGQLENALRLPDGDVIKGAETPAGLDPDRVGIALKLNGVTWWKGIQAGPIVLCQCQDSQNYISTTTALSDLQGNGLQFWKAKLFGVHTQMYNLVDVGSTLQGGRSYVFEWQSD
jgi:hypothetical protein